MVLKFLLVFLAGVSASATSPAVGAPETCSITYVADNEVRAVMREHGFIMENYDAVCKWLATANYKPDVFISDSGVLNGRSFGWATVFLIDVASGKKSKTYQSSTHISQNASTPGANEALAKAVSHAIEGHYVNRRDIDASKFQ